MAERPVSRGIGDTASRAGLPLRVVWLVVAAEATVAYAFFGLLLNAAGEDGAQGALAAPVLYAGSFVVQRLIPWHGRLVLTRWLIGTATGVVAALLALKAAFLPSATMWPVDWALAPWRDFQSILYAFPFALVFVLAAGVSWARGALLGARRPTFHAAAISFQCGAALLLATHGLAALTEHPVPQPAIATLAYFSWGLLGVALAHRRSMAEREPRRRDGQWLWLIIGSVVLAVAVGAGVGLFLDEQAIQLMLVPVRLAGDLLGMLLDFLSRLLYVAPSEAPLPEPGAGFMPKDGQDGRLLLEIPEDVRRALQIIWALMMGGILLFAFYRMFADLVAYLFRRAAPPGSPNVERLSGAWLSDLRAMLRTLLNALDDLQWWLHRLRHRRGPDGPPVIGAVRETYRSLLYWAAKRGLPRAARETPYEYMQRLRPAVPDGTPELKALTDCYVRARYCPQLVGKDEQVRAEESWRRLRRMLRR